MRFWLTKNSELPVREQLIRQVTLGILSQDLPPGHKLPSVRALARRHRIHSNTVSSAYHDLLERGWLELRRGSGLYVRAQPKDGNELEHLLAATLLAARQQGFEPEAVLQRLEQLIRPRTYNRILVTDPEPELLAILQAEIRGHVPVAVDALSQSIPVDGALVTGLAGRATTPAGLLPLRLRSVRGSLEGQPRPGVNDVVSIVSRSTAIRHAARAMLIAVGLGPESLVEVDANHGGWQSRLGLSALVIADVLTGRDLPAGCPARVFRVISDSSLDELKRLFPS